MKRVWGQSREVLAFALAVCLAGCPPVGSHDDDDTADDDSAGDDDASGDDDTTDDDDSSDDDDTTADDDDSTAEEDKWIVYGLEIHGTVYDLGRDGPGQMYLLWKDGPLQFGRLDGGIVADIQTLPDSTQINTRYTRPRLAVAPDGSSFHTTWFQGTPGEELFHAWSEGGGGWSREAAWDNGGAEHYVAVPAAGVDLTGTVHLIGQRWWYGPDGISQDESAIMALGKPAGGSWSAHSDIHTEAGKNWRDTSVFSDPSGGVHATWKSHSRPGKYRYAASGSDLTVGDTLDIPLPGGESTTSFGDTTVDGDGRIHHAFFAYPGNTLWHVERAPGATEFGEPVLIASVDNDEHAGYENPWPGIAVDSDGRIFVTWAENRGQADVPFVMLAHGVGGAWTVAVLDDEADIDLNGKPAITAVGDDVFVVWRGGGGELALAEIAIAGP
jgi:hypothetical protein